MEMNKDNQFVIGALMTIPFIITIVLIFGVPWGIGLIETFPLVIKSLVEKWDRWLIVFWIFGSIVMFFVGAVLVINSEE